MKACPRLTNIASTTNSRLLLCSVFFVFCAYFPSFISLISMCSIFGIYTPHFARSSSLLSTFSSDVFFQFFQCFTCFCVFAGTVFCFSFPLPFAIWLSFCYILVFPFWVIAKQLQHVLFFRRFLRFVTCFLNCGRNCFPLGERGVKTGMSTFAPFIFNGAVLVFRNNIS